MNAPDPLADYLAASPRHSAGLAGRSGVHGQVDAALNELEVPATLDKDGDWKLQTDVGPFLLVVDKESSDLVAIQTIQSMERKVKNSAEEMHVLMALNFEARGIARFGIVEDGGQNLLVLTARLAPDELSTAGVQGMLRDCLRLSRRVDELLGNAPAQAPAPAADQAPADAPAGETVFAQPVPQAPEPEPAAPTYPPPAYPEPAPVAPDPAPAPPEPSYPPPAAPDPAPAYQAPPQQALPPANWYEDPYYQARLRYWDGQQWTEHVAQ